MKKLFFVFVVLLIILSPYQHINASFIDGSFSYGGSDFLMGSVVGEYLPNGKGKYGVGLDLYYFQQEIGTIKQKSYASSLHGIYNLQQKQSFALQLLFGFGISQSFYDDTKSDVSFSPNIGISGAYKLSEKFSLTGKTIFLIYSDGFSEPYSLSVDYRLNKKISVSAGISGKNDLILCEGETSTTFKLGGMAGVRYGF